MGYGGCLSAKGMAVDKLIGLVESSSFVRTLTSVERISSGLNRGAGEVCQDDNGSGTVYG